jgi:ABC-type uncharacterized transport system YnjBCD substrate-binding protein
MVTYPSYDEQLCEWAHALDAAGFNEFDVKRPAMPSGTGETQMRRVVTMLLRRVEALEKTVADAESERQARALLPLLDAQAETLAVKKGTRT